MSQRGGTCDAWPSVTLLLRESPDACLTSFRQLSPGRVGGAQELKHRAKGPTQHFGLYLG